MSVGCDLPTDEFLAGLASPALREADKKVLVVRRPAVERQLIRIVGGSQTCKVGNALAQDLLTVDGEIGQRLVGVVLRGERGACGSEVLEILRRPQFARRPCASNWLP